MRTIVVRKPQQTCERRLVLLFRPFLETRGGEQEVPIEEGGGTQGEIRGRWVSGLDPGFPEGGWDEKDQKKEGGIPQSGERD